MNRKYIQRSNGWKRPTFGEKNEHLDSFGPKVPKQIEQETLTPKYYN